MVFLLPGCSGLSQFEYDGAGNFNKLVSYRNKSYQYNDNLDNFSEFDSIVLFHVKIVDLSKEKSSDKLFGSTPIAMFRVTDQYFNSTPALKKELYRRGDFARFYHHYIYGDWIKSNSGNTLETYTVFGVKSKINDLIFTKMRLKRFAASEWLDIPIHKVFKIIPGSVNCLGTLSLELAATGEYSDKTLKQAYFKYDTAIVEGAEYATRWKLNIDKNDLKRDIDILKRNQPRLFEKFKDQFQVIQ